MPTPKAGYQNAAGERIPGTTSVISANLGWNKQALMWWSNQMGLQGKSHREESAAAADIGTQAHALVEAHIRGKEIVRSVQDAQALAAFDEYVQWQARSQIEIVAAEVALVSETLQYGGTLDAIGRFSGQHELLDWKSSNGTYSDHLVQLAAYAMLWEENHPDAPLRRIHLCRFDKAGGFHHHSWAREQLVGAGYAFKLLLELHSWRPKLEKMI